MSLLVLENVYFSYKGKEVLKNINLSLEKGTIVSILGPNGSGKTTLLKLLLNILKPSKGIIKFEGIPLNKISPKMYAMKTAYVPQLHRESFAYKVIDVVLLGRLPYKSFFSPYSKYDYEIALKSLEKLRILHYKDRPYTDLSGGERQLVLIARAITQGADILVMDEPVNSLDYGNQYRILRQIMDLRDEGITVILSTHFPDHAMIVSDRVIMMKNGSILDDGNPKDVINPENIFNLYNIEVEVVSIENYGKICIPKISLKNKN